MKEKNGVISNREHRYTFRLTDRQNARFLSLVEQSGAKSKTHFITTMLFEREFRVVTTDIEKHKYYSKLCDFHRQFRGLATNYNQVTKRIHTVFDDHRARYLLRELREISATIGDLMRRILENAEKAKDKWQEE
jgi:hypothetical protein